MKTTIRSYGDEATDFHNRKITEVGSYYFCWLVKLIDSVLKTVENYYSQVFLKECNYIEKQKIMIRYITDDLKLCVKNFLKLKNFTLC